MSHSHKKTKAEPAVKTLNGWLRAFIDYVVCAYMIMIIVGLPFYFHEGYTYIATRKNTFFQKGSTAIVKVMLVLALLYGVTFMMLYYREHHTLRPQITAGQLWQRICSRVNAVDFFAGLYGLALCVSYLCTDYRESAGWGANGWCMGFYTQMILVGGYFLISKAWKPRRVYFYLVIMASAVVFLLGYLNRFSIYPIEMALSSPSYISTIGNINWYCGYVTAVFFAGAAYLWQGGGRRWWQKGLLMLYIFLGFATLVTQGSASGIAALGVTMLVMFVLSAGDGMRMLWFWVEALLLSGACVLNKILREMVPGQLNYEDEYMDFLITGSTPMIMTAVSCTALLFVMVLVKKERYCKKAFQILAVSAATIVSCCVLAVISAIAVNTMHPGSLGEWSENRFFTFSDFWGSSRGITWRVGILCFAEQDLGHKFTGVGPDAMAAYIYSDGSEELLAAVTGHFGSSRLTNAHNEWITILVGVGVLGLISFGGLMLSGMAVLLRQRGRNLFACSCGLCLVAYTVNNIFSFQQIMNVTAVFVLLGMGAAYLRGKG